MKHIALIIVIILSFTERNNAQSTVSFGDQAAHYDYDNLIKYWNLRQLMRDKMLVVSDVAGGGRASRIIGENTWWWGLTDNGHDTNCQYQGAWNN